MFGNRDDVRLGDVAALEWGAGFGTWWGNGSTDERWDRIWAARRDVRHARATDRFFLMDGARRGAVGGGLGGGAPLADAAALPAMPAGAEVQKSVTETASAAHTPRRIREFFPEAC